MIEVGVDAGYVQVTGQFGRKVANALVDALDLFAEEWPSDLRGDLKDLRDGLLEALNAGVPEP